MADIPDVEVGQVWESTDPRDYHRGGLTVVEVEDGKARLEARFGRRTWVSISRMKPGSRGYRRVE